MKGPAVEADQVVFRYDGHPALEESTFEIPDGAITVIIGPNGSGKSTLLNGIAGLIKPVRGTLRVRPLDARRRGIAYVLQTTDVNEALPVTVREVVTMGRYSSTGLYGWLRSPDRQAVDEAMARMGISNLAGRHIRELSGGQRQRVFVAQGLVQEHEILLLDEPLTGLDLTSARAIHDVIHEEHERGCTVVMTTHDLEEARNADHVILLSGRVVGFGPPEEVLTVDNLTDAYGVGPLRLHDEELFLDDPIHRTVRGLHEHRDPTGLG